MSVASKHILLLPGDGIGPEVVSEVEKIIAWMNESGKAKFTTSRALIGGSAYDAVGTPYPDETIAAAKKADAIMLGAVGGPKWEGLPYASRPERGLLGLRKDLQLFANLRPALCFPALAEASTLKSEIISGLDIMIVRELTGGIYFGEPRGVTTLPDGTRRGINTEVYTSPEVQRIARVAFELALKRGSKVCSVDKANVLEATEMWREEVIAIGKEYPGVALSHMYVDNAAMQLVRAPKQFDVMVTTNLFGDILSDIAAQLTGSLGMLPSASLGYSSPRRGEAGRGASTTRRFPMHHILENARELRQGMTNAEEYLWSLLRREQLGFKFRKQHPIGSYIADFACLNPKVIVELDGSQHVADTGKDTRRTAFLESEGFTVLRFWNNDVFNNTEGVLETIYNALSEQAGPHPNPPPAGEGMPGVYEPVHGSAPDIAGKGIANPIANILSFAMMLRYSFDMKDMADAVEAAVKQVLNDGYRTADIMQDGLGMKKVSTSEMGDAVLKALSSHAARVAASP